MAYNPKDYYFHKAKAENFAARSVFKLQEIDERFKILKPGLSVLDLGAAPGSWSQYCSSKIGPSGRLLGIDLQPILLTLPNCIFVQADFVKSDLGELLAKHGIKLPLDLMLSDMAPKTTGIRITDQARSFELCELALGAAERFLKPGGGGAGGGAAAGGGSGGGNFVCKLFHSDEFEQLRTMLRVRFNKIEVVRPKSTRKESKEIFLVGLGFKGPSTAR